MRVQTFRSKLVLAQCLIFIGISACTDHQSHPQEYLIPRKAQSSPHDEDFAFADFLNRPLKASWAKEGSVVTEYMSWVPIEFELCSVEDDLIEGSYEVALAPRFEKFLSHDFWLVKNLAGQEYIYLVLSNGSGLALSCQLRRQGESLVGSGERFGDVAGTEMDLPEIRITLVPKKE